MFAWRVQCSRMKISVLTLPQFRLDTCLYSEVALLIRVIIDSKFCSFTVAYFLSNDLKRMSLLTPKNINFIVKKTIL